MNPRAGWRGAAVALAFVLAPGLEAATIHKVERASRDVEAAVLLDADTGHTLYALESFRVQAPASTVKLMLLLVVSEAVEMGRAALTDTLVVSKRAADTGGQQLYLARGERYTLSDIATATAVHSANDAAVCLAEGVFGSYEAAVRAMNAKAVALGLASTFFTTPHGLPASRGQHEDRSTALDLARLGREAITHETLMTWCGTERTRFPNSVGLIVNSNRLLGSGGVDGLKTGFTNRAGFCLIASAEREGRRFVCAILGGRTSRARYDMASALFDLAMESERRVVLAGGRAVASRPVAGLSNQAVRIAPGRDIDVWFGPGERTEPAVHFVLPDTLALPVVTGQRVGHFLVYRGAVLLDRVPGIALDDVYPEGGLAWLNRFVDRFRPRD